MRRLLSIELVARHWIAPQSIVDDDVERLCEIFVVRREPFALEAIYVKDDPLRIDPAPINVPAIRRVASRYRSKATAVAIALAAIFIPGVNRVADMGLKIAIPFEDIDLVSFAAAIRNTAP